MMIPEKALAGLFIMTVDDLFQLPPVRGKLIFSQFFDKDSMKYLLGLQLWHLFKYAELTEVLGQNDKLFINLLHKVRVGNIDDDVGNLLKARFIYESDENYPKYALHMYLENKPAMKRIAVVLNDLPGELYTIEANDEIPDNCKYPLLFIQLLRIKSKQTQEGLAKFLKLEIGAKVMLTVNIDIWERIINGQTGIIRHIEFAQGSVCKA